MKRFLAFAFFLSLGLTISFAQEHNHNHDHNHKALEKETTMAPDQKMAEGPQMSFESTEVDYGTIGQHSEPFRYFKFTNTGTEPLVIKHAKGSCGCTVPTYPKEPILPGESGIIEVRYDTKRIGKFTKRVTLTTNEASSKRVLTIKGETFKKKAEPAGVPSTQPSILTPTNKGN